jgi:8-amino-7-oxononanoate synthase
VVEYIKYMSQAVIFSAPMAPANVAAVRAALKIIRREPERIERLRWIGNYVRQGFKQAGLKIIDGITPIVPVIVGDDTKTFQLWRRLLDEGVFVNAVVSPAAPAGLQIIRTSYMATHENHHLDKIIETFARVGREFGVVH